MAVLKAFAELLRIGGSVKLGGKKQAVFSNSKPRQSYKYSNFKNFAQEEQTNIQF
jgi:hypothetical protein